MFLSQMAADDIFWLSRMLHSNELEYFVVNYIFPDQRNLLPVTRHAKPKLFPVINSTKDLIKETAPKTPTAFSGHGRTFSGCGQVTLLLPAFSGEKSTFPVMDNIFSVAAKIKRSWVGSGALNSYSTRWVLNSAAHSNQGVASHWFSSWIDSHQLYSHVFINEIDCKLAHISFIHMFTLIPWCIFCFWCILFMIKNCGANC